MISEPERIASLDEHIDGWYIRLGSTIDPSDSELTWSSSGSGPELQNSDILGPFATAEDAREIAQAWENEDTKR